MKQRTEGELRKLLEDAYVAGARSVEPGDGCEFLPYGHEVSDVKRLAEYVIEVLTKV